MRFAILLLLFTSAVSAGQVLRKGNATEPETLDPHRAQSVSAANVLRDLYEGLAAEAPDGTVIPGAAERWTVSDAGRSWTFHLRREARWSNGDALTADDFAAGLRRAADPRTGSNYSLMLAPIENAAEVVAGRLPPHALGVRALDEHTLHLRLRAPAPHLPGLLTHSIAYPVHRPSLAAHGERFARAGTLVGNGAYVLGEWTPQSRLVLERNPHYWDKTAGTVDRVIYYPIEDPASELKRYRAGELDWTDTVPLNQLRWLRANLAGELHLTPYLGVYYYGFNLQAPPFKDNPKLRRALALALDRETLTRRITGAGEAPAHSWVPVGVANYTPMPADWAAWPREQRLAEARRLYAEAGYSAERPLEMELRYNTSENHKKVAIAASYMWKQALGVRTRLVNEEFKVFMQNRRHGRGIQLFCASWIGDYNDPNAFLELLHSSHRLNDTGFDHPVYDGLIEQAAVEPDPDRRRVLLQDAERLLLEELPLLPVYHFVSKRLVKPSVQGWRPNIMDHHATKYFSLSQP